MEKKFTSDEVPLKQLLGRAKTGELQLPDFQRGWVWDDEHITNLLASISLSYPIGAVMTLRKGNPEVKFKPRLLEGVELADPPEPDLLLLDGQQRTTSLYLSLMSGKPVKTRDARGNERDRWYYADMAKCLDPASDREDAIVSIPADKIVKKISGEEVLNVSSTADEVATEMFPLGIVLDSTATMEWQYAYVGIDPPTRMDRWMQFHQLVIQAFDHYQVPTIELAKSTPKDAVCAVFEKVNTGGVVLNVFELVTATYAADDFNLRQDWDARRKRLHAHDVLRNVDAPQFLQVVCLLSTFERRRHLVDSGEAEKAPAISCKRKDVLDLPLAEFRRWGDAATEALLRVAPFLHTEHIFKSKDVPYATQLVPLAAMLAVLSSQADGHGARAKIRQWYWSGVFGELYGGSTETRFAFDLPEVVSWIANDSSPVPRTVHESQFQASRLLSLRTRNSAAYKGLYALQMRRGARDLRTGQAIDVHAYFNDAIDIHHIFPQAWCGKNGIDIGLSNSIVNKTPLDAKTNQSIGGRAPSTYLSSIEKRYEIDGADLDGLLRSHEVDAVALRHDDFQGFFNRRFERLLRLIEDATGKPVNRTAEKDESPFAHADSGRSSVETLIKRGEGRDVEFKSTGRVNLHTGAPDPKIEWAIVKTIAGFMNASGGTLLVGIGDSGSITGIETDYPFVKKPDEDGWGLWFTDTTTKSLGQAPAADVGLQFIRLEDHVVARIDVPAGPAPVFAKRGKGDAKDVYVVRINSSTQELTGPELLAHQKQRWGNG